MFSVDLRMVEVRGPLVRAWGSQGEELSGGRRCYGSGIYRICDLQCHSECKFGLSATQEAPAGGCHCTYLTHHPFLHGGGSGKLMTFAWSRCFSLIPTGRLSSCPSPACCNSGHPCYLSAIFVWKTLSPTSGSLSSIFPAQTDNIMAPSWALSCTLLKFGCLILKEFEKDTAKLKFVSELRWP